MSIELFDPTTDSVSEQAAEWLLMFEDGLPAEAERRQFLHWLKRSPVHIEAFLEMTALHRQVAAVAVPQAVIDRMVAEARAGQRPLGRIPRAAPASGAGRVRRRRWPLAASASVLLLVAGLLAGDVLQPGQVYRSGIGEQRSIALADGSVITLNTQSRVRVWLDQDQRQATLLDGEAMFDVARDTARPFRVNAGDLRVHVIGTRFNLYRLGAQTQLTVLEGRVAVETGAAQMAMWVDGRPDSGAVDVSALQPLGAGDRLVAEPGRVPAASTVADPQRVTSWIQRRLIFEDAPLAEVVAEFNRYNRRQIHVDAAALASRRITGVFKVHDIDLLIGFLRGQHDLRVIESRDGLRVVAAGVGAGVGAGGG